MPSQQLAILRSESPGTKSQERAERKSFMIVPMSVQLPPGVCQPSQA
jgi:hypothetical protein